MKRLKETIKEKNAEISFYYNLAHKRKDEIAELKKQLDYQKEVEKAGGINFAKISRAEDKIKSLDKALEEERERYQTLKENTVLWNNEWRVICNKKENEISEQRKQIRNLENKVETLKEKQFLERDETIGEMAYKKIAQAFGQEMADKVRKDNGLKNVK